MKPPELSVVVPCYNEESVLSETAAQLERLMEQMIRSGQISSRSSVCFVDDGSTDETWSIIQRLASESKLFGGIKLSRNHGHQHALLAGLLTVTGDAVVSVDADLQDDLSIMPAMVEEFLAGSEIVYAVRRDRGTDSWFKRATAEGYYRLLRLMGVKVVFNHGDYRLLGRRALKVLREYKEANLFLRALIPQLGFQSAKVYFDRRERFAGESKYPLRKMLALAFDGVTSFSAAPLRFITFLGILISFASFGIGAWAIGVRLFNPKAVPGWASIVVPVFFLGGIQLLSTGIVGQYLAKMYSETKARPRFIIEHVLRPEATHAVAASFHAVAATDRSHAS